MPSTRTEEEPVGSGLRLPPGAGRSRRWAWFRETKHRHLLFRIGVFVAGLLLVLLGGVLWLFSGLLAAPPVLVGLWLWSREFHWAHRLLKAFVCRVRDLWARARAHPVRWAFITAAGIATGWAAYWAWGRFGP